LRDASKLEETWVPLPSRQRFAWHREEGIRPKRRMIYPRRRWASDVRCGGLTTSVRLMSGDLSSLTASSVGFISMQTGLSIGGARQPRRSRRGAWRHPARATAGFAGGHC